MSQAPRSRAQLGSAPKKPMARATRVTLFEREIRERLSEPALELLFARARVLTEGRSDDDGGPAFFGTVMLSIDLGDAAGAVRDRCDGASARRVAALLDEDARVERRLKRIAEEEAARLLARPARVVALEARAHAHGSVVQIDVEIEARPAPR